MNTDLLNPLNCCNPCKKCGGCGGCGCGPSRFDKAMPVGCECPEQTATSLAIDCQSKTLTYNGEAGTQVFTGEQLSCLFDLSKLSDVNVKNPNPCSMLVFNPGCGACPCDPGEATWQAYTVPEATEDLEPDSDGKYRVLGLNDCGCIAEYKLPVVATEAASINYVRDSVPDDPDFPYYYGIYNDTINLYLEQNAPQYFGKYDLEVTVYYGIQVFHPTVAPNVNFRSLIVPVVEDTTINVEKMASILQDDATVSANPLIPWGTKSMRGSFAFIVPKGKEAYLHHEFRLRSGGTGYLTSQYDRQRVPDEIASQVDRMVWIASHLNALQVIIKPISGTSNFNPRVDDDKQLLEEPIDEYPPLA